MSVGVNYESIMFVVCTAIGAAIFVDLLAEWVMPEFVAQVKDIKAGHPLRKESEKFKKWKEGFGRQRP
jgi:hypothetical protein